MTAATDRSLTARAASAVQWRFAGSLIAAISQFAIGVLLARLLPPADFGVIALALMVLGLAGPLGDLGVASAVVQRADLTERHVRTAFTFTVLFGVAVAIALASAAPLAARVFRSADVEPVMRLLAVGFAIQGLSGVSAALLRRHLDFRRLFFIDVAGSLLGYGGVAVALALLGYGVWSLAWANVVQSTVRSAALLISMRHPMRPLLGRDELRGLLHFGVGGTAVVVVNYFALNGDNFVVGRWSGAGSLGLYARAYTLMNLPFTHASNVMSSVLFPALAKVQHEPVRLRRAYLLLTELLAMVAAPAMVTLGIAAPHLVSALYGPQWLGVVAPLQILCLAGYFRALYHLGGIVAQSAGRVYSELKRQVVYAVLVIGGAFVGLRYGLPGVAAGVGIAIMFMFLATGQLCLGITRTSWPMYFRVQRAAALTALVTLCVVASLRWLFERLECSSATIAFAVLSGAAVPWSAGMLWTLGRPDFELLRERLPKQVRQLSLWMARRESVSASTASSS